MLVTFSEIAAVALQYILDCVQQEHSEPEDGATGWLGVNTLGWGIGWNIEQLTEIAPGVF